MKKFKLVEKYRGYANKTDPTNLDPGFLIPGSQNVIINNGEKVYSRAGYSLFGASNTALNPIESSFDWLTSTGTERNLRGYDDELEVYYSGAWRRVKDGYSNVDFSFTTIWDTTELLDLLIFVNGDSNLHMWSGGMTTFASATTNTITKEGTDSWAVERFLKSGTRSVVINGTTYTYTGGEGTTTLTGVTPDPTLAGHAVGSVITQSVRTTANTPAAGFNNTIVSTLKNQLYVGDTQRRDVFVSKNSNYTDFTYTVGAGIVRVPGEGALLTLDATPVAFAPQEEDMYVATTDGWFRTNFTLASDLLTEDLKIERLKTLPNKGALGKSSVCKIQNDTAFFTRDKTIDFIGRIENINTTQSRPISDPIEFELLDYDVTISPHLVFHQNILYCIFPSEGKTLMYDFEKAYWNPPQILPIRRGAIIDGELYGHSAFVPETYKLFDETTYSDNGNPIDARAAFAYRNYGQRSWQKTFDEWYTEGYINSNTTLLCTQKYDFGGFTQINEHQISGTDSNIIFSTTSDGSIGKSPLGKQPLGSITDSQSNLSKFRIIKEMKAVDFYEISTIYSSNEVDYQWELLAFGGNVQLSVGDNQQIKQ